MSELLRDAIPIPGLTMEVTPGHLLVRSARPLRVVTTAPVGGDLRETPVFLSVPAPPGLSCFEPSGLLSAAAGRLGIVEPFVGFVTAVKLTNATVVSRTAESLTVTVVATVGVTNAARPGEQLAASFVPGTINLVVVVDGDLSPGALHEALTTAAEAKALAVLEGGVRTASGLPATGTSTDAYAIACTGEGRRERYAGTVSLAGYLVGQAVREAVGRGLPAAVERARRELRP
ncbi:MAG: adenosylcobinamide amidohydrolase [Dehalococcoidia bacterium]